jgi:hypothetical protein
MNRLMALERREIDINPLFLRDKFDGFGSIESWGSDYIGYVNEISDEVRELWVAADCIELMIEQHSNQGSTRTTFIFWLRLEREDALFYTSKDIAQVAYFLQRNFNFSYSDFLNFQSAIHEDDYLLDPRPFSSSFIHRAGNAVEVFDTFQHFSNWDELVILLEYASDYDGSFGTSKMTEINLSESYQDFTKVDIGRVDSDLYLERLQVNFESRG